METNYTLEEILWTGPEYGKGLFGKKVLVLGYYNSNAERISDKEYINDNKLRKFAEYMETSFHISQSEFVRRIAYVNLYNEKERRKEDFESLILSLNPNIVIAFGVNLRRDIFINKNIISYENDLYNLIIDDSQNENNNVGYIHRMAINGLKQTLLLTAYNLSSNNYKFTDDGKFTLFMNICFNDEMYKMIINSKLKEPIRIKTAELNKNKSR